MTKKCSISGINKLREDIRNFDPTATDAEINAAIREMFEEGDIEHTNIGAEVLNSTREFLGSSLFEADGSGALMRKLLEEQDHLRDQLHNLQKRRAEIINKDAILIALRKDEAVAEEAIRNFDEANPEIAPLVRTAKKEDTITDAQKALIKQRSKLQADLFAIRNVKIQGRIDKLKSNKDGTLFKRQDRTEWVQSTKTIADLESLMIANSNDIQSARSKADQVGSREAWALFDPDFIIDQQLKATRKAKVRDNFGKYRNFLRNLFTPRDENNNIIKADRRKYVDANEISAYTPFSKDTIIAAALEAEVIDSDQRDALEAADRELQFTQEDVNAILDVLEDKALAKAGKLEGSAQTLKSIINVLGFEEASKIAEETSMTEILDEVKQELQEDGLIVDSPAVELVPSTIRDPESRRQATAETAKKNTVSALKALGLTNPENLPDIKDPEGWLNNTNDKVVTIDAEWDPSDESKIISIQIAVKQKNGKLVSRKTIYGKGGPGNTLSRQQVREVLQNLESEQNAGSKVVTYNGNGSDLAILSAFSGEGKLGARIALRSIDVMNNLQETTMGPAPKLQYAADALQTEGKYTPGENEIDITGESAYRILTAKEGEAIIPIDPATGKLATKAKLQEIFERYAAQDAIAHLNVFLAAREKEGQVVTMETYQGSRTGGINKMLPTWQLAAAGNHMAIVDSRSGMLAEIARRNPGDGIVDATAAIGAASVPLTNPEVSLSLEAQEAFASDIINGLLAYEESGRGHITEAELDSIIRHNSPRLSEFGTDVINDYLTNDAATLFKYALIESTDGDGQNRFDVDKLREYLYAQRSLVLIRMGEIEGARLAATELDAVKNPNAPSSEHSALVRLNQVKKDGAALKTYGRKIFTSTEHPLSGQYILHIDDNGNYVTTSDAQEYIDYVHKEILRYVKNGDLVNSYEQQKLVDRLVGLRDPDGVPLIEGSLEGQSSAYTADAIRRGVIRFLELTFKPDDPNFEGSVISSFGNGITSYQNARDLARGAIDILIGKREGVKRHQYTEEQIDSEGNPANPDTLANPYPSKHQGNVSDVNHSSPATQADVERVKSDTIVRARVRGALAVKLTPERIARIKEFLRQEKQIRIRHTRKHPTPINLVPPVVAGDPRDAAATFDEIEANFLRSIVEDDILYFHYEHDSETMPVEIEGFNGQLDPELGKALGYEGSYAAPLQISDGTVFLASPFSRLGAKALAFERLHGFEGIYDLQLSAFSEYINAYAETDGFAGIFTDPSDPDYTSIFDGTFQGLHLQSAMLANVGAEKPFIFVDKDGNQKSITTESIKNMALKPGEELASFVGRSRAVLTKILKEKHDVDYHLLLAQRALKDIVEIANDTSIAGDIKESAVTTLQFMQRHGVLPDVPMARLIELVDRKNLKSLLEEAPGLRSFFKPATMDRTYGAGIDTIMKDLREDGFTTDQLRMDAVNDTDNGVAFDFIARILKGNARKAQAVELNYGLQTSAKAATQVKEGKAPKVIDEVLMLTEQEKNLIITQIQEKGRRVFRETPGTEGRTEGTIRESEIQTDGTDAGIIKLSKANTFDSPGVMSQLLKVRIIQQAALLYDPKTQKQEFDAFLKEQIDRVAKANKIMIEPLMTSIESELRVLVRDDGSKLTDNEIEAMLEVAELVLTNNTKTQKNAIANLKAIFKEKGARFDNNLMIRLGRIISKHKENKNSILTADVMERVREEVSGYDKNKNGFIKALNRLSSTGRSIDADAASDFGDATEGFVSDSDLLGLENFVLYHQFGIDAAAHRFYPLFHKLSMYASEMAKQRGVEGEGSTAKHVKGIWKFAMQDFMQDDALIDALRRNDPAAVQMIKSKIEELVIRSALIESAHLDVEINVEKDPEVVELRSTIKSFRQQIDGLRKLKQTPKTRASINATLQEITELKQQLDERIEQVRSNDNILIQLMREDGMTDLVDIADPASPNHSEAVMEAWHNRSMASNQSAAKLKNRRGKNDAMDILDQNKDTTDNTEGLRKVASFVSDDRHPERTPRAIGPQERSKVVTRRSNNMGMAAFTPETAMVPFEHLGNPLFREWALKSTLHDIAPRIATAIEANIVIENPDIDVSFVQEHHLGNLKNHSTEAEDLRFIAVDYDREDMAGSGYEDVSHRSRIVEGKLRQFAKEFNLEEYVEQNRWEELLFLHKMRPRLMKLERQLKRTLLKDIQTMSQEDQVRVISEMKATRRLMIEHLNRWHNEATGKETSFYDIAPEGNIAALSDDVLFNDDGIPRSFRDVFQKIGNKFNGVLSFKVSLAFAPEEYVELLPNENHPSESGIINTNTSTKPRYVHGLDAQLLIEHVLSTESIVNILKKPEILQKIVAHAQKKMPGITETKVRRQIMLNASKFFVENVDPQFMAEVFMMIKEDPDYQATKQNEMFVIEPMDGWDNVMIDGELKSVPEANRPADSARHRNQTAGSGTGYTKVNSRMRGTTRRVGITLDGAIKMLHVLSNGQLIHDIQMQQRQRIVEQQRHVPLSDQLSNTDPMTGKPLEQIQLEAQIERDVLLEIKKRNSVNPDGETVKTTLHGYRRSYRNENEFAEGLDFTDAAAETENGNVLFEKRFDSASKMAKDHGVIPSNLTTEGATEVLTNAYGREIVMPPNYAQALAGIDKLSREQKIILGYMLSVESDEPMVGMVLNLEDNLEMDVSVFIEKYNKDNVLRETYRALQIVENIEKGSTDYSNPFYNHARNFVLGQMTTEAAAADVHVAERFKDHLIETGVLVGFSKLSPELQAEHIKLMAKALYHASREFDQAQMTPSVDEFTGAVNTITPSDPINPADAKRKIRQDPHNIHASDSLDNLVSEGIISQFAADRLYVILHNLSEVNPELLHHFAFEVLDLNSPEPKVGTHVISGSHTKQGRIIIDPRDFKADDLSAIDILLEEVVHIAQHRYLDLDENRENHRQLMIMMNNPANKAFLTKLIRNMHGNLRTSDINKKINYYLSNPNEFVAKMTVFFIKESQSEVLLDAIEADKDARVDRASKDAKSTHKGLIARLKMHVHGVMSYMKNTLLNIRSTFDQFKKESPAEYAKLSSVVNRVIGTERNRVNNREDMMFGHHTTETEAAVGTHPIRTEAEYNMYQNELDQLNLDIDRMAAENREAPGNTKVHSLFAMNEKQQRRDELSKMVQQWDESHRDEFGVSPSDRRHFESTIVKRYRLEDGVIDFKSMKSDGHLDDSHNNRVFYSIVVNEMADRTGGKDVAQSTGLRRAGEIIGGDHSIISRTKSLRTKYSNLDDIFLLSMLVDHDAKLTRVAMSGKKVTDIEERSRFLKIEIQKFIHSKLAINSLGEVDMPAIITELTALDNEEATTLEGNPKAAQIRNFVESYRNFIQTNINELKNVGLMPERAVVGSVPLKRSRGIINPHQKTNTEAARNRLIEHIDERTREAVEGPEGRCDVYALISAGIIPHINVSNGQVDAETTLTPQLEVWGANNKGFIDFIDAEIRRLDLDKTLQGDVGNGKLWKQRSQAQKSNFLQITFEIISKRAVSNGILKSEISMTETQQAIYLANLDKTYDPVQRALVEKIADANIQNTATRNAVEAQKEPLNSVAFRFKILDAELSQRAVFQNKTRIFDIDPDWALQQSMEEFMTVDGEEVKNPLFGYFETHLQNIGDDLHKGAFMDTRDAQTVEEFTGVRGMRTRDLLDVAEKVSLTRDPSKQTNRKDGIEALRDKSDYAMGRRPFVKTTNVYAAKAAAGARDMTLLGYGDNLTIASAIMEGVLSSLRGTVVLKQALFTPKLLANATLEVLKSYGKEFSYAGAKIGETFGMKTSMSLRLVNELSTDDSSLALYGLRHAQLRAYEENNSTLANDRTTLEAIFSGVGGAVEFGAGITTAGAAGLLTGFKMAIDGASMRYLQKLRSSGVLNNLIEVMEDPEIQEKLGNAKTRKERFVVIDEILKKSKLAGNRAMRAAYTVMGHGHIRKLFVQLSKSGMLNRQFLTNLNNLMQATSEARPIHGSGKEPRDKDQVNLSRMIEVAYATSDPEMSQGYLSVIESLSQFVNYQIESSIVTNNAMDVNTDNGFVDILMKIYRSYPTQFFNQRVLQDTDFLSTKDMVAQLTGMIVLDTAYMMSLDILKLGLMPALISGLTGFGEDKDQAKRRQQYYDTLFGEGDAYKSYIATKVFRSPVFAGSLNHIVSLIADNAAAYLTRGKPAPYGGLGDSISLQKSYRMGSDIARMMAEFFAEPDDSEELQGEDQVARDVREVIDKVPVLSEQVIMKPILDSIMRWMTPEAMDAIEAERFEDFKKRLQHHKIKEDTKSSQPSNVTPPSPIRFGPQTRSTSEGIEDILPRPYEDAEMFNWPDGFGGNPISNHILSAFLLGRDPTRKPQSPDRPMPRQIDTAEVAIPPKSPRMASAAPKQPTRLPPPVKSADPVGDILKGSTKPMELPPDLLT